MKGKWISIYDKLPEWEGQNVLICTSDDEIHIVFYHDFHWQHFDDRHKITHWMPLPDPANA